MSEETLDNMLKAIQEHANAEHDYAVLVDTAIVVFELVRIGDDGEMGRAIRYAVPSDNYSLSSAIGLVVSGLHFVKKDILEEEDEE